MRRASDRYRHFGMMRTHYMSGISKRHHDSFAYVVGGIRIRRRQHNDEFLALMPGNRVGLACVAAQDTRSGLQNAIAGLMAEIVIQLFEVIEIDERYAQRPFVPG